MSVPPNYPPAEGSGSFDAAGEAKGFFGALFDFGFNHFVTPKIVKIVYVLGMAAIALGALVLLLSSLASGEPLAILAAIILIPIGAIIYLAFFRMMLEMYYAIVRLSEDVHRGRSL